MDRIKTKNHHRAHREHREGVNLPSPSINHFTHKSPLCELCGSLLLLLFYLIHPYILLFFCSLRLRDSPSLR